MLTDRSGNSADVEVVSFADLFADSMQFRNDGITLFHS
jgi:hypothetical protein